MNAPTFTTSTWLHLVGVSVIVLPLHGLGGLAITLAAAGIVAGALCLAPSQQPKATRNFIITAWVVGALVLVGTLRGPAQAPVPTSAYRPNDRPVESVPGFDPSTARLVDEPRK